MRVSLIVTLMVYMSAGPVVRGREETRPNLIFRGVLAEDKPLDVFFAGDSAEAKTRVAAFLEGMDMRPLDAGGLEMAHALEWAGLLPVGLARNGAGFDIALGAEVL
jgi:predicted dinucleotide-binding enzyme